MKSKTITSKLYGKHIKLVYEARKLYKQGYTITWEEFKLAFSPERKQTEVKE